MSRPKILMALFRLPYPATDGTRYKILHNVAEGLKRDFDIEFFIVNIKSYRQADVDFLEKNFGKVHLFHHSKLAYGINSIPAFLNGLPLQAEAFLFMDAKRWLDAHKHEYDAFYVHEIRMTEYFIRWSDQEKKKVLVDYNDAISLHYRDAVKRMAFPKSLFYQWEGKRVGAYEARVLESFEHLAIISKRDREEVLRKIPGYQGDVKDFELMRFGANVSAEQAAMPDKNKLVFVGSLDYEPNRDALGIFIKDIWPLIRDVFPSMRLDVIGGGRVPRAWKSASGVTFKGFVPSVFEGVRDALAFVAPIRFAGGVSSKILEAMGYGLPVITNPEGVSGIPDAESGKHIIIVPQDIPGAWAESLRMLLVDGAWSSMSLEARKLVIDHYSKDSSQEEFLRKFHAIIAK